jgi:hypothetical protein
VVSFQGIHFLRGFNGEEEEEQQLKWHQSILQLP